MRDLKVFVHFDKRNVARFKIDGVRYVTRITATLTRRERNKYSDWGGMVGVGQKYHFCIFDFQCTFWTIIF